jgi:centromeric protein E
MATTIPRPSQPVQSGLRPPHASLPALPTPKSRKSMGSSIATLSPRPSAVRQSSAMELETTSTLHSTLSSSNLPLSARLNASSESLASSKNLRRTVSIASFPQPPKAAGSRIASLQGSPLALISTQATPSSRRTSAESSPVTPGGSASKLKRPMTITSLSGSHSAIGSVPSFLNNSGDGKSISGGAGGRTSDGLLSIPSPTQSRSSSAQGSYSTSATTNEDLDGPRGREGPDDALGEERRNSGGKEAKGNVLVSVRVRPDAAGEAKENNDWHIDSRKSLITFNGKEGGDYVYGKLCLLYFNEGAD